MLVNARGAAGITEVFGRLFAARFPLEEMRVTSADELTAPPTGDGNFTSAFVCRPARGQTTWSAHAYGLAVDVNPFCNPYTQGDLVLPELASAYVDRSRKRPGMVLAGDATVRAFAAIGWSWGGSWSSPKDRAPTSPAVTRSTEPPETARRIPPSTAAAACSGICAIAVRVLEAMLTACVCGPLNSALRNTKSRSWRSRPTSSCTRCSIR